MPVEWVKQRIGAEVPALAAELDELDPHPSLASLGQVHRARLRSGDEVAIKVRYPGVEDELEAQRALLDAAIKKGA